MNRWYKSLAGILGIPLLIFAGDKKSESSEIKETKARQTQEESVLETKIESMLGSISSKLSEKEIASDKYSLLIFDQLKDQGILTGEFDFQNAGNVGYMQAKLDRKLSVRELIGIKHDYFALKSTPVSKEAQDDVNAFESFKIEAGKYLDAKFGKKRVAKKEFEDAVMDYVFSKLEGISEYRKAGISGRLIGTYMDKFDIANPEKQLGQYSEKSIEKALERAEIK